MARKSLEDRTIALQLKMAKDQARLDQLRGRAKAADKKRDDRRKILIGAAVVGEIERDPEFRRRVMQLLHVAMVRPGDRAVLLDLLPEGSHLPAANTDVPPDRAARTLLPAASAEIGQPAESTVSEAEPRRMAES